MKKNNYMKIINTCHALFIGVLMLLPFIVILLLTFNSIFISKDFYPFTKFNLYFDFQFWGGSLFELFFNFFDLIFGNETEDFNFFICNVCTYYTFILALEFILGLFRKLFNYIMCFIMGGDSY